ncbi:hypothetical protein M426DRAFT_159192 [Hypoxylon sp. CI-4A]|nr:hypothetical protein M426DRAFT_159192 [Hypoxylon sp. CI-4A]
MAAGAVSLTLSFKRSEFRNRNKKIMKKNGREADKPKPHERLARLMFVRQPCFDRPAYHVSTFHRFRCFMFRSALLFISHSKASFPHFRFWNPVSRVPGIVTYVRICLSTGNIRLSYKSLVDQLPPRPELNSSHRCLKKKLFSFNRLISHCLSH